MDRCPIQQLLKHPEIGSHHPRSFTAAAKPGCLDALPQSKSIGITCREQSSMVQQVQTSNAFAATAAWLGRSCCWLWRGRDVWSSTRARGLTQVALRNTIGFKWASEPWSVQGAELDALRARVETDSTTAAATDVAEREAALEAALLDARSSLQSMRSRQEATQSQLLSMQVRCRA